MSTKIGMFIGSTTGKTESVASLIQEEFGGKDILEIHDISECEAKDFNIYDTVIIGCPTWNIGDLQSDWEEFIEDSIEDLELKGKKIAYFGTGDQCDYPDSYQDAIGLIEEQCSNKGAITCGTHKDDSHEFNDSKAFKDGTWVGLAIDEDNQPELTQARIEKWVTLLKEEFKN
jgi:flavodoxin I